MSSSRLSDQFSSFPALMVKKGEVLLRAGERSAEFYYVESGCLRSYILDKSGKENVYQFAPEDWIISDEEALSEQGPSKLYIDAIEDSRIRVIKFSPQNWEKYLGTGMDSEAVIRKISRKVNALRERVLLLISANAEDRYAHFLKTYPNLAQRVPLKMIASYLGMTPESLSRIRKDITGKK